jgi:hypothetical protein
MAFAEAYADVAAWVQANARTLNLTSVKDTALNSRNPEAFNVSSQRADVWSASRTFAEALNLAEQYVDLINWLQANSSTLSFLEGKNTALGSVNPEAWLTTDARRSSVTALRASIFATLTRKNTSLGSENPEAFATTTTSRRTAGAVARDGLAVQEVRAAAVQNRNAEALSVVSTYVDLINWLQANLESFGLASTDRAQIAKRILRSVRIADLVLRNATGVFGDVVVRNTALTEDLFRQITSARAPVGFDPFKPFLPGDYLFQTAIINATTEPADGLNETVSIQTFKTTTDVQDLSDRSTESVPSGGKTITFGQAFTVVPEVIVQQTGGLVTAIPVVSAITTTSFFVRLFDAASPATGVAGTISWSATGY